MGIKSLDYFRKLNTDSDTSTVIGGMLTLIAFVVMDCVLSNKITSVLVYNETKLFLKNELIYNAVIDNDTEQFVNINVDITVKAPCLALSLDQ